jgi:hypothetical protein
MFCYRVILLTVVLSLQLLLQLAIATVQIPRVHTSLFHIFTCSMILLARADYSILVVPMASDRSLSRAPFMCTTTTITSMCYLLSCLLCCCCCCLCMKHCYSFLQVSVYANTIIDMNANVLLLAGLTWRSRRACGASMVCDCISAVIEQRYCLL